MSTWYMSSVKVKCYNPTCNRLQDTESKDSLTEPRDRAQALVHIVIKHAWTTLDLTIGGASSITLPGKFDQHRSF